MGVLNSRKWVASLIVAGMLFVIAGPIVAILTDKTKPEVDVPTLDQASHSAQHFFDKYGVSEQSGDASSESQGYAMLIAVATHDRDKFDAAWNSSKPNEHGLDIARALSLAAVYFKDDRYAHEAREVAKAVADDIAARQAPYSVNLGNQSPRSEQELAKLTGDSRWTEVMKRQREIIDALDGTPDKPRLPPDWANVALDGAITPASAPGSTSPPVYSRDAARIPIRLAESCDAADRVQAGQMWKLLSKSPKSKLSAQMSLTGKVQDRTPTAIGAVAAAAAAKAAGNVQQTNTLLKRADEIEANNSTYDGAAWAALGRIMLTTDWLGDC